MPPHSPLHDPDDRRLRDGRNVVASGTWVVRAARAAQPPDGIGVQGSQAARLALAAGEPASTPARSEALSPTESATLLEQAEQSLRESGAVAEMSRLALDAYSLEVGADAILGVVDRLFPSSGAALAVVDEAAESLRFVACRGSGSGLAGARLPLQASMMSEATRGGAPIVLKDARSAADPSIAARVPEGGAVVIALSSRHRIIGALFQFAAPDTHLGEGRVAGLARIAAPVALALDVLLLSAEEGRQRERERMLAAALTTMEQPVLIVAIDGRILYANGAAVREFGYERDELTGMRLEQLAAAPIGADEQADLFCALAETGVWTAERPQRRKDGSSFPATVTCNAIEKEDRGQLGLVVHVRNLTEERRMAEQLRQTEKMAAIGELVAGVAHEVNNPLTGISVFAQLLLEEDLPGDAGDSIRLIKRESDRAAEVIRDLLLFARNGQPRTRLVDLNAVIRQTLRLRSYSMRLLDVDVRTELMPGPGLVRGDEQRLQQVIVNLLVNAEHAMQQSAERRLTIRTSAENGQIIVEIADTGIGMSPDIQPHIFEPFFTTKGEGAGTGLGLSVSYGIVQSHGGTIAVQSTPGSGSIFRLAFPAEPGGPIPSTGLSA